MEDMLKKENRAKYLQLTKAASLIANISFWIIVCTLGLMLILGTLTFMGRLPLEYINNASFSLDGAICFNLSDLNPALKQSVAASFFFTVSVFCFIYGAILYFILGILKSVRKGSPFIRENATRLSMIGYIFLVGAFVIGFAYAQIANIIITALQITSIKVSFQFNSEMFVSGLLFLIIAGIFRYGSYLQDEYDATL